MIELTYLALIGIALATMFFGYGFGLFEGRRQGYKKRQKEGPQEETKQPSPQPEVVTQTVTETVTVQVDDPGMLRIKNEGGAYRLDLDGMRVDPTALPAEQRKRLIEILNVMRPWLEGRPAPAPTPPAATSTPPPSLPAQTPPAGIPFRPAASASLSSSTTGATPPAPTQEPRQSALAPAAPPAAPANPPKPGVPAKDAAPPPAPKSIVGQIDAILQTRLTGTPLEKYAIHLTESPQGGANVYVGSNRYDTVDEVPDPEIKAAIRAATKEWEDKYTPGL